MARHEDVAKPRVFTEDAIRAPSKNSLFPRLRRQLRARQYLRERICPALLSRRALGRMPGVILMYPSYAAVLRAVLPCTHEKSGFLEVLINKLVFCLTGQSRVMHSHHISADSFAPVFFEYRSIDVTGLQARFDLPAVSQCLYGDRSVQIGLPAIACIMHTPVTTADR